MIKNKKNKKIKNKKKTKKGLMNLDGYRINERTKDPNPPSHPWVKCLYMGSK